jgi:hypothetical protein
MSNSKINKFFKKAIDQMFKVVGFDGFDEEFVKNEDWYSLKTWSQETENKYKEWFFKHAKKDLKWEQQTIEKEYAWFNLMYGWKSQT